jgi:hypothetical protein
MPTLREMAEDAALNDMVGDLVREQFRSAPVPRSPDVRAVVDELGPIPECREAVERVAVAVALAGVICGFLT